MRRRTFFGLTGGLAAAQLPAQWVGSGLGSAPASLGDASRFFGDEEFNYIFLGMLGPAFYGVADVGPCLAVADRIRDGDPASAVEALTNAGEHYARVADAAAVAGRLVSARQAYFQAANFIFTATYFVDGMGAPDRFAPLWRRHQSLWNTGAALLHPPMEHVRIPYQGTTLPGYFFKVDDTGLPRPLLIFNNGSDGGMTNAVWPWGAAPGVERGYNVLTFYGPGQGLALVDQHLYFRPDWEHVITPLVDYVLNRPEVDPQRIALMGVSQGGYWVPRALAFEHRIAAAIADPGVWDVATSWLRHLPPEMRQHLDTGREAEFNQQMERSFVADPKQAATFEFRARPYGLPTPYDVYMAVRKYDLEGVFQDIRTPIFIADPEDEQFWPGQARQLYKALPGPKLLERFTAAEGANLHCEVKAPGFRARRMFDWLDATLATRR